MIHVHVSRSRHVFVQSVPVHNPHGSSHHRPTTTVVKRIVWHAVFCPTRGLAQNVDADTDKNNEDAGYGDHGKHPVVENTNFWIVMDINGIIARTGLIRLQT